MTPVPVRPQKPDYYPFIDGLRSVAILMVLFHHTVRFFSPANLTTSNSLFFRIAEEGRIGVDLFFVISGFLITGILIRDESAAPDIRRFYVRRFFKIYPQYILCMLVCLGIPFFFPHPYAAAAKIYRFDWQHLWPHLVFIQNYVPEPLALFNHAWSLAIEEHFYFLYPLIMWLVFKFTGKKYRLQALGIVVLILMAIIIVNRLMTDGVDQLAHLTQALSSYQTTLMRIDALMAGCLIKIFEDRLTKLPKHLAPMLLMSGALLWACRHFLPPMSIAIYIPVVWIGASCLFLSGLIGWKPWNGLLESKPMRWIGKSSYGIYLWHFPLIFLIAPLANLMPMGYVVSLHLLLTFIAGAGSTATIERISLKIRNRIMP